MNMQSDAHEYIAYRHDKYTHATAGLSHFDEEGLDNENRLTNIEWNQFIDDYSSLATSNMAFKRLAKRNDDLDPDDPAKTIDTPQTDPSQPARPDRSDHEPFSSTPRPAPSPSAEEPRLFLSPIIGITVFFAVVIFIGPFLVRKGPNRGIVQCSIMLTAFCMWIFWVTVYIGQMNPLIGPRLDNTTVAWIALKLGNPVKPVNNAGE